MATSNHPLSDENRPGLLANTMPSVPQARTVLVTLAVLYIAQVIYYVVFHPLQKIPGPFLARFSGLWRNIRYFRGTWHDDVLKLHEKYGPVVRIAPNEVSFVDRKALLVLYGHGTSARKVRM